MKIRLLAGTDLDAAERASDRLFLEADRRTRVGDPEPTPRTPAASAAWIERMRHYLAVDPAGCWVAVDDGEVAGFAISQDRGARWYLAT